MRKCKICGDRYEPRYTSFQKTCNEMACILSWGKKQKEKEQMAKARKKRREVRDNDRGYWLRKTQMEFNKWIRLRDANANCISCCLPIKGQKTAGHYRSVGAHPELRFDESNVHLQCGQCNTYKSGNLLEYRKQLLHKIGVQEVERLEGPHPPKQYTLEDLKAIFQEYKARNDGHNKRDRSTQSRVD